MNHSESDNQIALFEWAKMCERHVPQLKLLHSIPNGGKREVKTAVWLKKEGQKSGVPDIFLPVPRQGKHGLYIEMKSEKGNLTDNQRWWRDKLIEQGYRFDLCRSWEHAKDSILNYLGF
jgi:hypothetical protein